MKWASCRIPAQSRMFNAGRPSGVSIFVRPNQYETGRATIVVYNWDNLPIVSVDATAVLQPGQRYQILDAQNFFGPPVVSGTFDGNSILVPMTGTAIAQPVGNVPTPPSHTLPEFGIFLLVLIP